MKLSITLLGIKCPNADCRVFIATLNVTMLSVIMVSVVMVSVVGPEREGRGRKNLIIR
jgi:hypothetical protein